MAAAKYRQIASALAERIRLGEIPPSGRLPGEMELAQEFEVSRGTIRQALSRLQQDGLIETLTGSGSFVNFDGDPLSDASSWSRAFATKGVSTSARLLALGKVEMPTLAARLSLPSAEFLVVDRVRMTAAGESISLERSRVPWRSSLETVVATGLVDESLAATMEAHGLVAAGGRESIGVAVLGTEDAELLGRSAGEAFLKTEHTIYDVSGAVIEFVTSLLQPTHFRIEHSYGTAP
ncbi:GntR family transcriptional regulator [Mycolicibacterium hippocampi]|uniref:Transcriptional regulator, GntR family n=1 Tax=Mycolicibacterium hippocampi TaxID=659824 RepID=A0A850PPP8_9MYCO|nr:GntR family transcriptional regulator [Mycolicibacterium hippocampi]NVN50667.1 Transcriptional regulator, GntR family [Mycolicibacterium hippocampi]